MDKVLTRQLKVYCPQHQAVFEVAESPKIVCEIKEHALSNNFPHEEFWEYCCDCQTFFPSQLVSGGKAKTACPQCERPTLSRFLCNLCNVLTFDSGENTRDKRFYLSLDTFAIVPACPGCLTDFTDTKLHLHKCSEIRAVLETPRAICPFCKKDIVKNIDSKTVESEPPIPTPLKIQKESDPQSLTDIRIEQKNLRNEINELKETVLLLNAKVEKQHKFIQSLAKPQPQQKTRSEQTIEQPANINRGPQFPVSVENYLNRVGNQGDSATPDKLYKGLLVQDPGKEHEFIIVKDTESAGGFYHAVPRFARFSSKSEFNLYYRDYYYCDNPSSGTVWLVSPTIVRGVEGGWSLLKKGKLEMR